MDEADMAVLDVQKHATSDPDLLHAKLQFEQRVQFSVQNVLGRESPLPIIQ